MSAKSFLGHTSLLLYTDASHMTYLFLFLLGIVLASDNISLLSFGSTSHVVVSSGMVFHSWSCLPVGWYTYDVTVTSIIVPMFCTFEMVME